jgi:DNA-binding response OmpR family regulator
VSRPFGSSQGLGPAHKPAFLVLQDDPAQRARLTSILLASGVRVFPAGNGEIALAILREHNERIVCVITDTAVPGPISGWVVPYWSRFLNPFVPVIYVTDNPELVTDTVDYAVVLNRSCGARELVQALSGIRSRVEQTAGNDIRAMRF